VGGIVSATLSVHEQRWAPIEYPKISNDGTVGPLREAIAEIQGLGVRYIIQIGDPGAHTQMSLFNEAVDGRSSSRHLDLLYGYRSLAGAMSTEEISAAIENFAQGARRVREAGADGVEITASKGYLIHQFLNPPGSTAVATDTEAVPTIVSGSCGRSWRRCAEPWAKISSSVCA
jgi:2,4-dienoyl-CoA reductase-like NADH-dependent reductase (Old Yellow Enzyme family)